MRIFANICVIFVALCHFGFLVLEMFLWDHPIGRELFSMTEQQSAETAILAANQGLYNGFLAVGLFWGLIAKKRDIVIFLLLCVLVAGIFGAVTASQMILFVQALPGAIALVAVFFAWPRSCGLNSQAHM
ncbi:MAG: DUF1304 domain-containing protein [Gammaproteobacteria bacterium]|nr:DUF1304 domain-containing protein [Gammaproteobacteria bacterium]